MKIDMDRLRKTLKETAERCRMAKLAIKETQRRLRSERPTDWKQALTLTNAIAAARGEADAAAWFMTSLCVFRAALRGRTHLSPNSTIERNIQQVIDDGYEMFKLPEPAHDSV